MAESTPVTIRDDDWALYKPGHVAALFGVDPKTASRWVHDDKIPDTPSGLPGALKTVGGHHRFRGSALLVMLRGDPPGQP